MFSPVDVPDLHVPPLWPRRSFWPLAAPVSNSASGSHPALGSVPAFIRSSLRLDRSSVPPPIMPCWGEHRGAMSLSKSKAWIPPALRSDGRGICLPKATPGLYFIDGGRARSLRVAVAAPRVPASGSPRPRTRRLREDLQYLHHPCWRSRMRRRATLNLLHISAYRATPTANPPAEIRAMQYRRELRRRARTSSLPQRGYTRLARLAFLPIGFPPTATTRRSASNSQCSQGAEEFWFRRFGCGIIVGSHQFAGR